MKEKEMEEENENENDNVNERPAIEKKTVLRAPPRNVVLASSLIRIKDYQSSGPERHYFYFRIILIITDLISLGFGIYILVKKEKFLNKSYDFNYRNLLLGFIYIYSPSAIGIFLVSLVLSIFVYCFFWCCEKQKIYGAPLYDEKDITLSAGPLKENEDNPSDKYKVEIKEEYIGINADKVTLLPYTMTIFVIMTIVFYFVALPLSIILLTKMWKDSVYKDKKKYWPLYVFVCANLVDGVLIVVVFFHMFLVKRIENSILKKNMEIDENVITSLRNEVRNALKIPK